MRDQEFGWLLVHFRDDVGGESIHFSLSDGDDPLRWTPLYGGRPLLTSNLGTRGVRDPVVTRDDDGGFHILATDLNVESGAGDWNSWVRTGSRSIVIWDSADLVVWSEPRLVEVAPPTAGMAWAPDVVVDPANGDRLVFWSSRLYSEDDPEHLGDAYSRILFSRTRDFVEFTPAEVLIDAGRDIIDTAILLEGSRVHRISKHEHLGPEGLGIHHEVGSTLFSDDYRTLATRVAADRFDRVEAPILFRDHRAERWYLFLDQYSTSPQGYVALETDDLLSGRWEWVPADRFSLRPGTKHGGILSLTRAAWERLAADA